MTLAKLKVATASVLLAPALLAVTETRSLCLTALAPTLYVEPVAPLTVAHDSPLPPHSSHW